MLFRKKKWIFDFFSFYRKAWRFATEKCVRQAPRRVSRRGPLHLGYPTPLFPRIRLSANSRMHIRRFSTARRAAACSLGKVIKCRTECVNLHFEAWKKFDAPEKSLYSAEKRLFLANVCILIGGIIAYRILFWRSRCKNKYPNARRAWIKPTFQAGKLDKYYELCESTAHHFC